MTVVASLTVMGELTVNLCLVDQLHVLYKEFFKGFTLNAPDFDFFFFFFSKLNVKTFKHLNVSSSCVGLISRLIKMAFAGILKDDDVAAALKECAGKTHLL